MTDAQAHRAHENGTKVRTIGTHPITGTIAAIRTTPTGTKLYHVSFHAGNGARFTIVVPADRLAYPQPKRRPRKLKPSPVARGMK